MCCKGSSLVAGTAGQSEAEARRAGPIIGGAHSLAGARVSGPRAFSPAPRVERVNTSWPLNCQLHGGGLRVL